MTALTAFNNNTLLRKWVSPKVLVGHSDSDPEVYGDPENTTVAIPSGQEEKISWGQRKIWNAEYIMTCELKRCALVLQLTTATQDVPPLIAATVWRSSMRTQAF